MFGARLSFGGAGMALAILAAFGFSFKAIFVKLAYPYGVDAITLLTLRMVFALPVFLWVGLTASRGMPALSRRDWFGLVAMGLFCTALPVFAQSAAIRRLGSARVALVSMLGPLATIGFAVWLLGEPLSLAQVVGAALVIAGIALVSRRPAA